MLLSCWFFMAIERVVFFLWHTILLSTVWLISITESISALLKVRLLLSNLRISTRAISALAAMTDSPIIVTKQWLSGRWHLRRFYWLYDIPPVNYESGKNLVQGWVKRVVYCFKQKFMSPLYPHSSANLKSYDQQTVIEETLSEGT